MSNKRKPESHSRAPSRPRVMKSGGSRADSERDSGFSDAGSEHMSTMDTTDSEDSPCPVVQQGPQAPGSRVAVLGGSYSNLSRMIIMNNVLLKPPENNPPALKPWAFSPAVEVVQPVVQQPQVVFLQPVVSRQSSPVSKETTSRHKRPKKYLPILKSYPKIAPHPGDKSSSSGRGTASLSSPSSSSSYSSSSLTDSKRGNSLISNHREHSQREKHPRSVCGSVSSSGSIITSLPGDRGTVLSRLQNRLSSPTSESSASSSPARERPSSAISQSEFTTSLSITQTTDSKKQTLPFPRMDAQENVMLEESDLSDNDADTKRKRFCNTYNILSKSGLLDIALRTKELLRQSRHTQNDLDRLKEHTDLFFQALRSGNTSICIKLQASLQEEDREPEGERAAQTSLKAD
ncbi:CLOCK-interacting pacemaker [Platichthys flesus]|uniref:CLOCK-interacting pacemaker n=1 Tax=Platichthys flesus TaxID=8260 RepID=UPI002DB60CFC|nr:CLOCK-interacting pacemaker [Platichthys flesus]XP_062267937.1 CLOCK-interacting pacemaker [Platichthys flesus]